MSKLGKSGNVEAEVEHAVQIGQNNKRVIAETKKWCAHIVIDDHSAGMIHEMYGLPMNQMLHCPHTKDQLGGMQFEGIARDFIIANCKTCKFHKEVSAPNFGRKVIAEHEAYLAEVAKQEQTKIEQRRKLFAELQVAEKKAYPQTTYSQKSILALTHSIAEETADRKLIAENIFEASKLAPAAFNQTVVDFLSMYFEDEFGDILMRSVTNIATESNISELARQKVKDLLIHGVHLDAATGLLSSITTDNQLALESDLLDKLISIVEYPMELRSMEVKTSYPNVVDFILRAYGLTPTSIIETINKQLKLEDKFERNNINGLIQEITKKSQHIGILFLDGLLNSLEFSDDDYYDSADHSTCISIGELFKTHPDTVNKAIQAKLQRSSLGAQLEIYRLLGMIAANKEIQRDHPAYCQEIVAKLVEKLLVKENVEDVSQKILDILSRISHDSVAPIKDHFDSLLGFLVERDKRFKTHIWYRKDLDKPDAQRASFNPYRGKNYFEIHSIEIGLHRQIGEVEDLIGQIIKHDQSSRAESILSVLINLDSDADGQLKARLIGMLRRSLNDPLLISQILPNLYTFMLDPKSTDVRDEALKLLNHLIDNHSGIVTRSFLDLVIIFLTDTKNVVKARAVECLGSMCEIFPASVGQEQISLYLKLLLDNYLVVHKAAARQVRSFFPLLNAAQKQVVFSALLALEAYYRQEGKDMEFCKFLVDQLLFVTKDEKKQYHYVVTDRLLKYCENKEYYVVKDALQKLTLVRERDASFSELWLKEILKFLTNTKPKVYSSFDDRDDFIEGMYDLPVGVVKKHSEAINSFIKNRVDQQIYRDAFDMLAILSYFNLHQTVHELCEYIKTKTLNVEANEWILKLNDLFFESSLLELHVTNNTINKVVR